MDKDIKSLVKSALKEDIGKGDATTKLIVKGNKQVNAVIKAKEPGVLCGIDIAEEVFKQLDKKIKLKKDFKDGEKISKNDIIAEIEGNAEPILAGERTALNFLQHLSGISTLTRAFVEGVADLNVKIMDTRKTLPLLRKIEKYAAKTGGAVNQRMGLYDMILIKDNHIKAAGSVKKAVESARKGKGAKMKIEIEAKTISQLKEILNEKVDIIMLDNMSFDEMEECVKLIRNKGKDIKIEASGGVSLQNVVEVAKCGVDYISIGKITHSAPALDFSLSFLRIATKHLNTN